MSEIKVTRNISGFVDGDQVTVGNETLTGISPNRIVFPDRTTKIPIIINLSQDEFTAILTTMMDTAPLRDPETWHTYTQSLLEAVEQPMDICDIVADCIANNAATQQALTAWLGDSTKNGNNDSTTTLGAGDGNILEGLSCDFNTIYGVAIAIEDYIYNAARDFFEVVLDQTLDSASIALILDFIPILGDAPLLDDIDGILALMRAWGVGAFDVGYNTTIRQNNICALFALACSDCDMQASDVSAYYASQAAISWSISDQFNAFIQIILGGSYTEERIVAATMSLVATVITVGSSFNKLTGLRSLQQIAANGTPNGGWAVNCDPCGSTTLCRTYDFSIDGQGWSRTQGTYDSGGYWRTGSTPSNNDIQLRDFAVNLTETLDIAYIEVEFELDSIGIGQTLQWIDSATGGTIEAFTPSTAARQTWVSTLTSVNTDTLELFFRSTDNRALEPGLQGRIYTVRVYCN